MRPDPTRRRLTAALGLTVLAPYAASSAAAFPDRPLRIVVGLSPGTATDIWARMIAQQLQQRLGQPVVVESKPGAGGQIATDAVAKAPADGTTLLTTFTPHATHVTLYRDKRLPYDFLADFVPVIGIVRSPMLIVTAADSGPKSLSELLASARTRPDSISYASQGSGSTPHLGGELLASLANLKLVHVPYKGTSAAHPDLIAGRVTIMFDNYTSAGTHIKSGRLRALAVCSKQRTPPLPNVLTTTEMGLPDLLISAWGGYHMRAGTPQEVIARLNSEINAILKSPEVKQRLAMDGAEDFGGTPESYGSLVVSEVKRWGKIIEAANIRVD